jgi:GTP pyrophosphokinase
MVAVSSAPISVNPELDKLLGELPSLSPHDRALITRAFEKAAWAHEGQYRKSGEPYITHCLAVAHILADMKLDAEAIAAALMHDVVEDSEEPRPVTIEDVRREFGEKIAAIVDGVTKLEQIQSPTPEQRKSRSSERDLEYIRKMAMTIDDDVRVVIVKLADRLHNMRTLGYMRPEKQQTIAQETLDIFAPLANRLGIWQIKSELEDLSFRYLDFDTYKQIDDALNEGKAEREKYMEGVIAALRRELDKYGLTTAAISGRPKHIFSIWKKMERKKINFEKIFDVRAVRVIVDTRDQCYNVMGIVHNLWRPISGEFDDYIGTPKDNFYQSLHTAVVDHNGKQIEVQIRTWEMHEHAEYGIAAHWRYKEGRKKVKDPDYDRRVAHLRHLMEFGRESQNNSPAQFVDAMKTDFLAERILVYTPNGDIVDLVAGSTPIDFAYHIHTDIGHRCRGAKVHGRIVNLDYQLKTGDQVEIITSKRGGPSLDWLNQHLGYVHTQRARDKIRYWFRKQNRTNHILAGREVLERELKRLGLLDTMSYEQVATALFGYEQVDDFLAQVGAGEINGGQISSKILELERKEKQAQERETLKARANGPSHLLESTMATGVAVRGSTGLLYSIAKCCHPVPGDKVIGFITRGRGVTVHRNDCPNLGQEPDRLIDVSWGKVSQEQRFSVPVEIIAYDRSGLMKDISTVIAEERVNMSEVNVSVRNTIATFSLTLELLDSQHLSRILARLNGVPGVTEVRRHNI